MQNRGSNEHPFGSVPGTPVAQSNSGPSQIDNQEQVRSYNLQYLKSDLNSSIQTVSSPRPVAGSLLSADESQVMLPTYAIQDDIRTPEVQRRLTGGSIKRVPVYDDQGQSTTPETVMDERHRLMPFGPPTTGPSAGSEMTPEPPGYLSPNSQRNVTFSPAIADGLGQRNSEPSEQRLQIAPVFANMSANEQPGNVIVDMSTPKKTLNLQEIDPNSVLGTIEITQNIVVRCLPGDGKINPVVPSPVAETKLRQPSEVRFSSVQPLETPSVYTTQPSRPSCVESMSNLSERKSRTIMEETIDMTDTSSEESEKKKKCCLCCARKKKKKVVVEKTIIGSDGEKSQAVHTEVYDGSDSIDSAKLEAQLLSQNAPPPDSAKSGCCKRKKKQKQKSITVEFSPPTSQKTYDKSRCSEIPIIQNEPCLPVEICSQMNTLMATTAFEDTGMQEGQPVVTNPTSTATPAPNQQPCTCMHPPFYLMPYFFIPTPNTYGQGSGGLYYCTNGPPYPYGNSLNNQPPDPRFFSQSSQKHQRAWCC